MFVFVFRNTKTVVVAATSSGSLLRWNTCKRVLFLGVQPSAITLQTDTVLPYTLKDKLLVLGACLDSSGQTRTSMEYALGRAESHYFKHQQILRSPVVPVAQRLRAWQSTTTAIASYSADSWHITKGVIVDLRKWELQMLRRLLRLRRSPVESFMEFNRRTAARIYRWQQQYGVKSLFFAS